VVLLNAKETISHNMIKAIIRNSETYPDKNDKATPWWSFTKTVMATAILKLVETGKINLDSCLEGKTFTYRQLLQHTSGLKDYGALDEYHQAVNNSEQPWSIDELYNRLNVEELLFEPGKGWSYSNIGYLYLKHELERITNTDLATALNDILFTPLNLNDAKIITTPKEFRELNLSKLTNYNPGWCYHGLIAGLVLSSAKFLHMLSSGKILKDETFREMSCPYKLNVDVGNRPWKNPAIGLGLMMDSQNNLQSWGHTGQGPESTIAIYHFKKHDPITVAVFEEINDMAFVENEVVDLV
jgi:CubicO group peptidase (beta-lactamase class C family)